MVKEKEITSISQNFSSPSNFLDRKEIQDFFSKTVLRIRIQAEKFFLKTKENYQSLFHNTLHPLLFGPTQKSKKPVDLLSQPIIMSTFENGLDRGLNIDPKEDKKTEEKSCIPIASEAKTTAIKIVLFINCLLLPPSINIPTFYWINQLQEHALKEKLNVKNPEKAQETLLGHLQNLSSEKQFLVGSLMIFTTLLSFIIPSFGFSYIALRLPLLALSFAPDELIKKMTSTKEFQAIYQTIQPFINDFAKGVENSFKTIYQSYVVPILENLILKFVHLMIEKIQNSALVQIYGKNMVSALKKYCIGKIILAISLITSLELCKKGGTETGKTCQKLCEQVSETFEKALISLKNIMLSYFFQKLVSLDTVQKFAHTIPLLAHLNRLVSIFSLLLPDEKNAPLFPGMIATTFYLLTGSFVLAGSIKVAFTTTLYFMNKYHISLEEIVFPSQSIVKNA